METIQPFPATPSTAQISHLRSSAYSNPATADASSSLQASEPQQASLSAPASQESIASQRSTGSSVRHPRLENSSSNVSQLTAYTDSSLDFAQQYTHGHPKTRLRTPEAAATEGSEDSYALASPMSLASPAFMTTNGTKRTASGHVKNAPSLPGTPATTSDGFTTGRLRGDSISSTSSRASELAMNLKTRLGYAMAKVQNGWEHRNISEVEQLAAHKIHQHRHSMSHMDYSRRPVSAGLSNGAARVSMHDDRSSYGPNGMENGMYHPSKRHSGNYSHYVQSSSQPLQSTTTPRLQPAADIRPGTSHHLSSSQPHPSRYTNSAMSPPRTPVNGATTHSRSRAHGATQPPMLRTQSQTTEAELEAYQALIQLGSPQTLQFPSNMYPQTNGNGYAYSSGNTNGAAHYQNSQTSSSQASPLRTEFGLQTTRRVTFARSESDSSAFSAASSLEGMKNAAEPGRGQQVETDAA